MNASTDKDQLGPFQACAKGVHDCSMRQERTALKNEGVASRASRQRIEDVSLQGDR